MCFSPHRFVCRLFALACAMSAWQPSQAPAALGSTTSPAWASAMVEKVLSAAPW